MEIKLSLDANKLVRIPDAVIAGEKTVISFESSVYDLGELGVTVTNGFLTKQLILQDRQLDVTEFCDRACRVDIKVDFIISGRVLKTWHLEPLIVRELDGGFEIIPQVVDFERRLERAEKIILEFDKKLNSMM